MEIQINDRYRIISEPMNIVLQELKTSKPTEKNPNPEPKWVNSMTPYHATVEQACTSLLLLTAHQSDATVAEQLIAEWRMTAQEIKQAVRAYQEGERVAV